MATKDRIYPEDNLVLEYEVRKPDPNNPNDAHGLPASVSSAFARVLDGLTGVFLDLNGVGVTTDSVTITPATGTTRDDTGAILTYKLKSSITINPGDYTVLVTAIFQDGTRMTESRQVKVLEYR